MPPKTKAPPKIQYTVEYVDVNNNGIADKGDVDLIKRYENGVLVSQQVVPHDAMESLANKVKTQVEVKKQTKKLRALSTSKRTFKTYENIPNPNAPQNQTQPVMVQDKTGFGQYIKAGAGLEAGRIATDTVVNAISGLFSGGNDDGNAGDE